MKVLSLYDGMACGMIAMKNAGIEVDKYDAYEIDKYAIKTATHNFELIEEHGDVFDADFTQHGGVDWLIGGSPCTYWSIAQKNNRETEASGLGWELFSQYVRALHEAKPKYFVYENNKSMSKEIRASIDKAFGFEAVLINSALVSAQNRQRLYWVGKRNDEGTYTKVDVKQPKDKGILLKDVLENAIAWREKSYCIDANYFKASNGGFVASAVAEPICIAERGRYEDGVVVQHFESRDDGKTNVLTTVQKDNQVCEPIRIGTIENDLKNPLHDSKQYRVYSPDGKATTLCGQGGGVGAKTGLYAVPVLSDREVDYLFRDKNRINYGYIQNTNRDKVQCITANIYKGVPYNVLFDEVSQSLQAIKENGEKVIIYEVNNGLITVKGKQYPIKLTDGFYIIRKMTVTECMRLQTVPDWYEFPVSNSQAYKMLGNGWTCDVITHLIKSALHDQTNI